MTAMPGFSFEGRTHRPPPSHRRRSGATAFRGAAGPPAVPALGTAGARELTPRRLPPPSAAGVMSVM
ncbi:hypothetical protein ACFQV4_32815 [Streptomyces thermocarboxydus]